MLLVGMQATKQNLAIRSLIKVVINGSGGAGSTGRYKIISPTKIEIIKLTEEFSNELKLPLEKPNPKKIIYIITKDENVLLLTLQKKKRYGQD